MKNEFAGMTTPNEAGQVIINGDKVLEAMSMDGGLSIWGNVIVLAISYLVLITASYIALYLISRRKK